MNDLGTVLIIDDDLSAQKSVESMLLGQGYKLLFATSGHQGLEMVRERKPDLVLLDIMMPDMDGFAVCRAIRDDPQVREIPILMLSSLDAHDAKLVGLDEGADDFITKPFDRLALRARIRTILRLNRYRHLQEERSQFAWVVDNTEDGYLRLSAGDDILYANPHARLYLDLPEEVDLSDKKFLEEALKTYRAEPQLSWENWPQESVTSLARPRYLVRPETTTAGAFWLEVSQMDIPSPENIRLLRLKDVTRRINAERDMRSFKTALNHKLRTPFSHIISSLDLLQSRASGMSTNEIVSLSKTALSGARRFQKLVDDLLQYAQLEGAAIDRTPFPVSGIPDMLTGIQAGLGVGTIDLRINENARPASLVFPRQAMELTLWEIVENSVKFHPTHEPVIVFKILRASEQTITIQIADNGVSLSPEQIENAWMPYYQGEKDFTGEIPGIGLGLTLVSTLVWSHGGKCRLANVTPGPGVMVELTFNEWGVNAKEG
jgi:DNA-binding response OmpR family regulator